MQEDIEEEQKQEVDDDPPLKSDIPQLNELLSDLIKKPNRTRKKTQVNNTQKSRLKVKREESKDYEQGV